MKLVNISNNCYAHLFDDRVFIYIDNEFVELLYIDDVENSQDPIPLIIHELELASKPSLSKFFQFF